MDDPPQPGPRLEMIYFCDGEGSFSTGLGEEVFLLSGKIATQDLLCEADCSLKKNEVMLWDCLSSPWCHITLTAGSKRVPPLAARCGHQNT